jgi:hypothetical protein
MPANLNFGWIPVKNFGFRKFYLLLAVFVSLMSRQGLSTHCFDFDGGNSKARSAGRRDAAGWLWLPVAARAPRNLEE